MWNFSLVYEMTDDDDDGGTSNLESVGIFDWLVRYGQNRGLQWNIQIIILGHNKWWHMIRDNDGLGRILNSRKNTENEICFPCLEPCVCNWCECDDNERWWWGGSIYYKIMQSFEVILRRDICQYSTTSLNPKKYQTIFGQNIPCGK